MRVLLGALERLNQRRAAAERIAVEAFLANAPSQFREHNAVKYRGLLPTASLTAALQECDLLYVPMSFLPRYEVLCRTSMAGKAVHYMQAQVPLLAHGPSYATNVTLVSSWGIGLATTTPDPSVLAEQLTAYERDVPARRAASARCREVFEAEYSPLAVWRRMERLLAG